MIIRTIAATTIDLNALGSVVLDFDRDPTSLDGLVEDALDAAGVEYDYMFHRGGQEARVYRPKRVTITIEVEP